MRARSLRPALSGLFSQPEQLGSHLSSRPPTTRVRFDVFEADLRSGELFMQGRKVKFRQQAFQALALLLEHPGEPVTRDEMRQRLWPSNTFVDFDLGLNSAIKRVRDALQDSANAPRFVETLPRRGYRFIAPVEPAESATNVKHDHARPTPDRPMQVGDVAQRQRCIEEVLTRLERRHDVFAGREALDVLLPGAGAEARGKGEH